jgi:tRNA (guanine37-N1)-methyltransferase
MKKVLKKRSSQTQSRSTRTSRPTRPKPIAFNAAKRRKPLRFDAISIFPEVFSGYMSASILGRAQKSKLVAFAAHNLRAWTHDRHQTVDDKPFGGGPGMVMKPQPFLEALMALGIFKKDGTRRKTPRTTHDAPRLRSGQAPRTRVIVTAANGKPFTHADAVRLAKYDRVVFLCGRYEGIDQRVVDRLADESFRIGEYVLTGGELPAMVMMDAIARQIPGVLGKEASLEEESWADSGSRESPREHSGQALVESRESGKKRSRQTLNAKRQMPSEESSISHPSTGAGKTNATGEYPQYTRPEVWLGMKVPGVLLSGNHQKIKEWRMLKRD